MPEEQKKNNDKKFDLTIQKELSENTAVEVYGECSKEGSKYKCRVGGIRLVLKK